MYTDAGTIKLPVRREAKTEIPVTLGQQPKLVKSKFDKGTMSAGGGRDSWPCVSRSQRCSIHRIWSIRRVFLAQAMILVTAVCLWATPQPARQAGSALTAEHLPPAAGFVGSRVCAGCHNSVGSSQLETRMAHSGTAAADSEFLRAHPDMAVRMGPYLYRIQLQVDHAMYSVSQGAQTVSVPLLFAFGDGMSGQTFVFRRDGAYYEARVSFYTSLNGLDLTMGHPPATPGSIEDALGRRMEPSEVRRCFSCHFTGPVINGQLRVQQMMPGVTCEYCHGPGERHVMAMRAGDFRQTFIFNPARLSPADSVKFCGSCHRTLQNVRAMGMRGVLTVRFQPYRLVLSRCWNPDDARITCISCHDPHQKIRYDVSYYDSKCLACHLLRPATKQTPSHPGAACPVGKSNCVTCHMPQGELPGSHTLFTDHLIRIVKPNEPFPEEMPPASQNP